MTNFITTSNYPALGIEILGNTVLNWLVAVVVFLAIIALLKIFTAILVVKLKSLAKKTKSELDDILINVIHDIHWPFYVLISYYAALSFLNVHPLAQKLSYYALLVAVVYYAVLVAQEFVDFGANRIIKRREEKDSHNLEIIKVLSLIVKISLWAVAVVLLLSNLGYNVTSLAAGLGIGGIAIALAIQNILSDIFSSVSIYFDKPFKVGDFIIIGDYMGVVKKIGIKTTRIQTLQGEELVVSNKELTQSKIRNFGLMEKRRVVFSVGVTYGTAADKLKKIPDMVKKIINAQKNATLDRAHFKSFGDFSLLYEVVYYVGTRDYNHYMDIQQDINLNLAKEFEKEGIEFAFPTQTVYVKQDTRP